MTSIAPSLSRPLEGGGLGGVEFQAKNGAQGAPYI